MFAWSSVAHVNLAHSNFCWFTEGFPLTSAKLVNIYTDIENEYPPAITSLLHVYRKGVNFHHQNLNYVGKYGY